VLVLVCPVYNESENIIPLLHALERSVRTPFELLVVYDREDDTTLPPLRATAPSMPYPVRAIRNAEGRGVVGAVRTGLRDASGDAKLVIMADLADDLRVVDDMYALISSGRCDLVAGSRYMRGGRQIGGPWFKGLLSRLAGMTLYYVAGLPTHDATNNFKMYARSVLEAIEIESKGGFEIAMEITVKAYALGFRIAELPSVWTDRVAGESRFRLAQWLPHYLRWFWYALAHASTGRKLLQPTSGRESLPIPSMKEHT
jgi:glycosyltransferase involved in cell wall biosynthesis